MKTIKTITKTELRKNLFYSNTGSIHIGFFIGDEPFYSIISKVEMAEYIINHPKIYKKMIETIAIDKFLNEDLTGILGTELKAKDIEVYYKNKRLV